VLGVCWGVSAIFVGNLSDRLGRRKVLVPAVVIFSLLSVFHGMATGLVSLLLIRGIMGVARAPSRRPASRWPSKPRIRNGAA